ncbi:MAG: hybrid sensor histidine kinase/response regulator [Cyclobacteriaceae bacterium]|nr:MAG: hybrid sensor histidine kinase/response regulator [Cyclobacteriaceae bacterium]
MSDNRYNILYVDDEENNLVVFKNAFFRDFNVFTTLSAEEGLSILDQYVIHLIVTDQKMPGMTGVEFLEIVAKSHPETMRMILTAYSDIDFIMRAVNKCGIYRYILKPWDTRELKIIIDNALQNYQLAQDKKHLLENLAKANRELEDKVRARTDELRIKNDELTKINAIKDKLFTIISHDLKQPLVSLSVFFEILKQLPEDVSRLKLDQFYMKLQANLQDVTSLLDNLLFWSQSQMGQSQIDNKPIRIVELVKRNIDLYQVSALQKGINIEFKYAQGDPIVLGDENIINLVMRNLLNNAIKYSKKRSSITVNIIPQNGHLAVSVKDRGVGMSRKLQKHIFEKEYHNTTRGTSNEKGTGLGLKLCKEYLEKQAGDIHLRSEKGKGSVVTFTIPLK